MDSSASTGTGMVGLLVILIIYNYNPRWAQGKVKLIKPKNMTLVNDGEAFSFTTLLIHTSYHIL